MFVFSSVHRRRKTRRDGAQCRLLGGTSHICAQTSELFGQEQHVDHLPRFEYPAALLQRVLLFLHALHAWPAAPTQFLFSNLQRVQEIELLALTLAPSAEDAALDVRWMPEKLHPSFALLQGTHGRPSGPWHAFSDSWQRSHCSDVCGNR